MKYKYLPVQIKLTVTARRFRVDAMFLSFCHPDIDRCCRELSILDQVLLSHSDINVVNMEELSSFDLGFLYNTCCILQVSISG